MSRVIVSIMSEQTIPNYIFIKEKFRIGDELLFISSQKMEHKIAWITSTLGYVNCSIATIVLDAHDEERWFRMCDKIRNKLAQDKEYVVNLTGGTKYMSMAVMRVFEDYDSHFYYIPFPKNEILHMKKDQPDKLEYVVGIDEYLSLYKVLKQGSPNSLVKDTDYSNEFFSYFVSGIFSKTEFEILDKLRAYREKGIKDINLVESTFSDNEKKPQVSGLTAFLAAFRFYTNEVNTLSPLEVQYLTGGWFEEYTYNKIKKSIDPTDIALGLKIKKTQNPFLNDLDVVFTLGNKLFVIECKTGISGVKMLNETVYKATALKETLFGLPGNTFIFSLGGSDEKFELTAKNMGITYYDRSYFTDEAKWATLVETIKKTAKP